MPISKWLMPIYFWHVPIFGYHVADFICHVAVSRLTRVDVFTPLRPRPPWRVRLRCSCRASAGWQRLILQSRLARSSGCSGTINHPAYGDTDYCQLAVAGRHALRRPIGYAREREMAEHRGIRHSRLYSGLRMADDGAAHVSG